MFVVSGESSVVKSIKSKKDYTQNKISMINRTTAEEVNALKASHHSSSVILFYQLKG